MLDEYRRLAKINKALKECKDVANSWDSIVEMQNWLNKETPKCENGDTENFMDITKFNQVQIGNIGLPEAGMSKRILHSV
jgi:hypothetical protein